MTFAKDERAALCELLSTVGPDAPTLCGDWTTHDLAAHLWIRETDPVGAPGILAKPLAGLTERRMAEAKARWGYQDLVERVAAAHRSEGGREPAVWGAPYGSDLRLMNGIGGVPTVHYGPGDAGLAHAPNESVPVVEVLHATAALARLAIDVCG